MEKYSPAALGQVRFAKPGWALEAMLNGSGTRAPRPTTGVGRQVLVMVPLPHWPSLFQPHVQTEPSALQGDVGGNRAQKSRTTLLKPLPNVSGQDIRRKWVGDGIGRAISQFAQII